MLWVVAATAYVFEEVSVDNSVLDFGVYYNYTISRGRDIVGAISLITQAFTSLLPSPRILATFGTCKCRTIFT